MHMQLKMNTNNYNIATKWNVLSGDDDWKDLLEPLDLDLRRYVLHYGERSQSIGDAFNAELKSKNCGLPLYPRKDFFSYVGLDKGNPYKYEVTAFIYAAYGDLDNDGLKKSFVKSLSPLSETDTSNWIGYVAVATDQGKVALQRRDILVVWRGSILPVEWKADETFELVSAEDMLGATHNPKVHKAWHTIYTSTNNSKFNQTSARSQVFSEVKKLMGKYEAEEMSITVTGHSMGAALATLNAVDMAYNITNLFFGQPNKTVLITAFAFACPRVGDAGFRSVFDDLNAGATAASNNLHILRVNDSNDIVPKFPLKVFGYVDVGQFLLFTVIKSPYIKPLSDSDDPLKILQVHILELYLHGIAGTHGVDGEFKLEIDRDIGLVNKGGDFAKDDYLKVVNWWVEKNKSMVQNDDGSWELDDSPDRYS